VFGEDGLVQSGIFSNGKLAVAFDFTNQASGFLSISGNYTKTADCIEFGERNEANNLHGKGIIISSFGTIYICYWNNGRFAPGNYLYIESDGDFSVGEYYMKDG